MPTCQPFCPDCSDHPRRIPKHVLCALPLMLLVYWAIWDLVVSLHVGDEERCWVEGGGGSAGCVESVYGEWLNVTVRRSKGGTCNIHGDIEGCKEYWEQLTAPNNTVQCWYRRSFDLLYRRGAPECVLVDLGKDKAWIGFLVTFLILACSCLFLSLCLWVCECREYTKLEAAERGYGEGRRDLFDDPLLETPEDFGLAATALGTATPPLEGSCLASFAPAPPGRGGGLRRGSHPLTRTPKQGPALTPPRRMLQPSGTGVPPVSL
eukprot:Hpha_TRINITY_DN16951_c0_g3::TRINITY_DN16951_c0_g3_i1::g.55130::m.55130